MNGLHKYGAPFFVCPRDCEWTKTLLTADKGPNPSNGHWSDRDNLQMKTCILIIEGPESIMQIHSFQWAQCRAHIHTDGRAVRACHENFRDLNLKSRRN